MKKYLKLKDISKFFLFLLIIVILYRFSGEADSGACSSCGGKGTCSLINDKSSSENASVLSGDKTGDLSLADINSKAQNPKEEADEFEPVNESEIEKPDSSEFETVDESEFEEAGSDEFETIDSTDEAIDTGESDGFDKMLKWPLIALFFTIISGILVRFIPGRKLRPVFLIAAIVFLGFYNAACPCPIMSFEEVILFLFGAGNTPWQSMIWFLGLIPITYVFGKVWCGWICHLGALQEYLYISDKFKFLQGKNAQRTMRIMRYSLVIALIVQLFISKTNEFCRIDPFKAIFNLGYNVKAFDEAGQIIIWSLVGLLLLTSLFIERPFCKAACPIGLVLGWVSKIPGASVLGDKRGCKSCSLCYNACQMDAITKDKKLIKLDNQDCIACGECMDACNRKGIGFFRKGKEHNDKAVFTYEENNTNCGADNCGVRQD